MAYIGTDDSSGDPVFQEDSDVEVRTYQRGRIRMVYAMRDNRVEEHAPDPSRPVFVMIHGRGEGQRATGWTGQGTGTSRHCLYG